MCLLPLPAPNRYSASAAALLSLSSLQIAVTDAMHAENVVDPRQQLVAQPWAVDIQWRGLLVPDQQAPFLVKQPVGDLGAAHVNAHVVSLHIRHSIKCRSVRSATLPYRALKTEMPARSSLCGPKVVVGHEAQRVGIAVHAHEQLFHVKLLNAHPQHGADHDLGVVLEVSAQQHHMRPFKATDIAGDEGGIRYDGRPRSGAGDLLRQQRAAASAFDHHGLPRRDQLRRLPGNAPLLLVVKGQAVVQIVVAAEYREAVLPANDAPALQRVQVLAHRHGRHAQLTRQHRDLHPAVLR